MNPVITLLTLGCFLWRVSAVCNFNLEGDYGKVIKLATCGAAVAENWTRSSMVFSQIGYRQATCMNLCGNDLTIGSQVGMYPCQGYAANQNW